MTLFKSTTSLQLHADRTAPVFGESLPQPYDALKLCFETPVLASTTSRLLKQWEASPTLAAALKHLLCQSLTASDYLLLLPVASFRFMALKFPNAK